MVDQEKKEWQRGPEVQKLQLVGVVEEPFAGSDHPFLQVPEAPKPHLAVRPLAAVEQSGELR